jgi:hypothetical protein
MDFDGGAVTIHMTRAMLTEQAKDLLAAALNRPDPATIRRPQVGDMIEVLWVKSPSNPWAPASVLSTCDPVFMPVKFGDGRVQSLYISRADRARNPNIDKGAVWRWPEKGGHAA